MDGLPCTGDVGATSDPDRPGPRSPTSVRRRWPITSSAPGSAVAAAEFRGVIDSDGVNGYSDRPAAVERGSIVATATAWMRRCGGRRSRSPASSLVRSPGRLNGTRSPASTMGRRPARSRRPRPTPTPRATRAEARARAASTTSSRRPARAVSATTSDAVATQILDGDHFVVYAATTPSDVRQRAGRTVIPAAASASFASRDPCTRRSGRWTPRAPRRRRRRASPRRRGVGACRRSAAGDDGHVDGVDDRRGSAGCRTRPWCRRGPSTSAGSRRRRARRHVPPTRRVDRRSACARRGRRPPSPAVGRARASIAHTTHCAPNSAGDLGDQLRAAATADVLTHTLSAPARSMPPGVLDAADARRRP